MNELVRPGRRASTSSAEIVTTALTKQMSAVRNPPAHQQVERRRPRSPILIQEPRPCPFPGRDGGGEASWHLRATFPIEFGRPGLL